MERSDLVKVTGGKLPFKTGKHKLMENCPKLARIRSQASLDGQGFLNILNIHFFPEISLILFHK
jgi:hypothetical protein